MPTKITMRVHAALGAAVGTCLLMALTSGCTNTATSNSAPPATTASPTAKAHVGHADHTGHEMGGGGMDHTMGTSGVDVLKKLKGREFDIAFLSQMITHHEAAVEMARQALKSAKGGTIQADAQKVITSQTGEIAQMTQWLKEWYDVTPSVEQQALVRKDMESMMTMPVTSDRMFYEMMIPHHQGAIDMSVLVPERSQRPEVKKLAEQIIQAQRAEIAGYHQALGHGAPGK